MGQAHLLMGSPKAQAEKRLWPKLNYIRIVIVFLVWGPIMYGPGPLAHGESEGPSRKKVMAQAQKYKAENGPKMQPMTV